MEFKQYSSIVTILFKFLEYFGVKYISKKQQSEQYISEVLKYIKVIVHTVDILSDEAIYAQQMVRKFYYESPKKLGDLVSANTLAKVMQALSAARVYYWVKFSEGKEKQEIILLLNARLSRIDNGIVRHNSPEITLQKIKDLKDDQVLADHELSLIRDNLFADIAELEEYQISIAIG
jgi:hypothetical protein